MHNFIHITLIAWILCILKVLIHSMYASYVMYVCILKALCDCIIILYSREYIY